jgi:hypothetical protein
MTFPRTMKLAASKGVGDMIVVVILEVTNECTYADQAFRILTALGSHLTECFGSTSIARTSQ